MRLIDADEFEAFTYQHTNDDFDNGVQFVLEKIDEAPTVCDIEQIRAEIDSYCSDNRDRNDGLYIAMRIIDKNTECNTPCEDNGSPYCLGYCPNRDIIEQIRYEIEQIPIPFDDRDTAVIQEVEDMIKVRVLMIIDRYLKGEINEN